MPSSVMPLAAELDHRILRALRSRFHSPAAGACAHAYAFVGQHGAIWICFALAGSRLDSQRRSRWLGAAGVVPAALVANFMVKLAVRRSRPDMPELPALGKLPATHSFPSGHAAASFAAAQAMATVRPRLRRPLTIAAGLMALTRPYLGVHYPSDVVAGAALGTAVGLGARGFLQATD